LARKLLRGVLTLLGAVIGCALVILVEDILRSFGVPAFPVIFQTWGLVLIYAASGLLFAIIFFILSPKLTDLLLGSIRKIENWLAKTPLMDVIFTIVGLIVGLLVALLLSPVIKLVPIGWLAGLLSIGLYLLCGYLGIFLTSRRRSELSQAAAFTAGKDEKSSGLDRARPKVLDTSVIIDGRIFDICKTGVVEGTLLVPEFVLRELRHIADSTDALKRGRGRRGLDILGAMQRELSQPVKVAEQDYDDVPEVDLKLLRLAAEIGGVVVTNDYNLNKVAAVQKVPVLNINELANAMKPAVLPGEVLKVNIAREGKEAGQGVAYLDDGTMVVVDGARRHIGEDMEVVVTSVLQTAAGRMIFAKL